MNIDDEARRVRGGILEFIGPVDEERWDLPSLPQRQLLGIRTHRRYGERRASVEGFTAEVPLTLTFEHGGYTFELTGRIDGLVDRPAFLLVEEVKSVTLEGPDLDRLGPADFPLACRQLRLYCYATWRSRSAPTHGTLVLCSVFDDGQLDLGVDWTPEEVESFLFERAAEILRDHALRQRWLADRQRAAPHLPFPFDAPRDVQRAMLDEVASALSQRVPLLLEAPTGSGKTAVAVYGALKVAFETGRRVLFTTAKTTGQSTALDVARRLRALGAPLSALTLTARAKMCLQDVVYCHPEHCPHAREYHEKLRRSAIVPQLWHEGLIERGRLKQVGEDLEICPFEVSLELAERVDLIICDYNYLFHPTVRLRRLWEPQEGGDLIVIVDEAHNLPARARGYYSPTLPSTLFQKLRDYGRLRGGRFGRRLESIAVALVVEMTRWVEEAGLSDMDGRGPWEPPLDLLREWQQELAGLLMDDPLRRRWRPSPGEEDLIMDTYRRVAHLCAVLDVLDTGTYVAWVERTGGGGQAGILCLDASAQLAETFDKLGGILAMSATLSPHDFYRQTMGLPSRSLIATFGSPFPRERRGIFIVDEVSTRYKERDAHLPRIAELIRDAASVREGSYVVFLPSYQVASTLRGYLERLDVEVLVDERDADDLVRRALLRRLAEPLGPRGLFSGGICRVLLAVQGGSLAEAIEWPAGVLRGVFVIGPGLPSVAFETDQLRAYYDQTEGRGFEYAYLYPGMTRVVQAAGRLIRRPEDEGIIVLMGERFRESPYKDILPRDWHDGDVTRLVTDDLAADVRRFWAARLGTRDPGGPHGRPAPA